MRSRFIVWCLSRFVSDDALIGDLVQERGNGRSKLWFCRQSAAAIALSMISTVQTRPILRVATLVVGYAFLWGGTIAAAPLSSWFRGWTLATLLEHPVRSPFLPRLWGLWLYDFAGFVPIAAVYALAGWLVGRFNRNRRPLVLAFAMLILFKALATTTVWAMAPLAGNRMGVNPLLFVLVWTLLPTSLALLGGSLGLGGRRDVACD